MRCLNAFSGDGWTHLLALIIQEVGGVDVKLRHQRGRRHGHAQAQVDGFGAAECGVVGESLEGNDGVLEKQSFSWLDLHTHAHGLRRVSSPALSRSFPDGFSVRLTTS